MDIAQDTVDVQYSISEAAKQLHVEAHVLRYWEEELTLLIPRNKMGHRVYGKKEMELFHRIMKWKEEGLSLKEIQAKCNPGGVVRTIHNSQIIPYPAPIDSRETDSLTLRSAQTQQNGNTEHKDVFSAEEETDKLQQFKMILGRIVADAIHDNSESLSSDIAGQVSTRVSKELDFLFREKEESDEKRYRQLDETIRSFQKARQEAAAAEISELKTKKKHRLSRKKKRI